MNEEPLATLGSVLLPQTMNQSSLVAHYRHSYALIRDQAPPANYRSSDDVLLQNEAVRIEVPL
jgi:hypothetical protein